MSKFNVTQTSFSAGQVSPKFKGRIDLKEHKDGLEQLENFIPQKQGGVVKRPGSQFIKEIVSGNPAPFNARKIVPFIFSKTDSFIIAFAERTTTGSPVLMNIYDSEGVQAILDATDVHFFMLGTQYDPANWVYSQSGDVIFFSYAATHNVNTNRARIGTQEVERVAPFFIWRDDDLFGLPVFRAVSFVSPNLLTNMPETAKFSPAIMKSYRDPNTDPGIRLYTSLATIGTNRGLNAVDASNVPIAFFTMGMAHNDNLGRETIGTFFKIQKAGTEGVCWGEDWRTDTSITEANINTGTDVITFPATHSLNTRDIITILTGGLGSTEHTLDGLAANADGVFTDYFLRPQSGTTITLHPSEADATANTNAVDISSAGDDGLIVQYKKISNMQVTIEVAMEGTLTTAAGASDDWQESAWSNARGFPKAVVFHEQKLVFGGGDRQPDTVHLSQTGNVFNMMARRLEQDSSTPTLGTVTTSGFGFILSGDVTVTDPFNFTIASKQANMIQWMQSQDSLLVGTLGAEYAIDGGDVILSNESIFVRKQTEYGSAGVQAQGASKSALYITRDGRSLRSFEFVRQNGGYSSTNLSILSDNMVFSGFDGAAASVLKGVEFREIYFQSSRDVVWLLTTNDELVGVTLSKEASIVAWHYHPIRSTDKIKSITVIPNTAGNYDELWLAIERDVDSSTVHYLEKIADDFEHSVLANTSTDNDDVPYYSDSAVKIVLGSTTDTVTLPLNDDAGTGSHLEGELVKILAGNFKESDKTVASNQVVLDNTYDSGTVIVIGLPYTSKLKTLDINAGQDFGSQEGNRQRVDRIAIRLYKSQGGDYGNAEQATLFPFEYEDDEVFDGIKRVDFAITPDMDNQILIEHDDPVPFNILSMTYRGVSYD